MRAIEPNGMARDKTSIPVSRDFQEKLYHLKGPGRSYEDTLRELLAANTDPEDLEKYPEPAGECPVCGVEYTSTHCLENGEWAWEPVENFGIADAGDGMVCASWSEGRLAVFYHSPRDVEREQNR